MSYNSTERQQEIVMHGITAITLFTWMFSSFYFNTGLIGFFTVIVAEAWLGFSVAVLPFCYFIGFSDKDAMARSMASSVIMLVIFTILRIIAGPNVPLPYNLQIFER